MTFTPNPVDRPLPPGTLSRATAALATLIAADPNDVPAVLLASPVLLRADVLGRLTEESAGDPAALAALDGARSIADALDTSAIRYVLGPGPVEQLWAQVEDGTRSVEQAVTAARALAVTEALTAGYVYALFDSLTLPRLSIAQWRLAWQRGRIARAAVDACDRLDDPELRLTRWAGVVNWAHVLLVAVPDGQLLAAANSLGVNWVAAATATGRTRLIASATVALARLWSDPYCSGRPVTNYESAQQAWLSAGWQQHTVIDGRPPDSWAMPEPVDALVTALGLWRAARAADPDSTSTLLSFADTGIFWHASTGEPVPPDVIDAVTQALQRGGQGAQGGEGDQEAASRLEAVASYLGIDGSGDATAQVAGTESDALVAVFGDGAGVAVARALELLATPDPAAALALVDRHRELIVDSGQLADAPFRVACQRTIAVLNGVHGSTATNPAPTEPAAFADHLEAVLSGLGADPPPAAFAAAALQLARLSSSANAEHVGLPLIGRARSAAPYFTRRYAWAIDVLEAELLNGLGVNAYRRADRSQALRWYGRSFAAWLGLGRVQPLTELFTRLSDVTRGADEGVILEVVGIVIGHAPAIVNRMGPSIDGELSALFAGLLGAVCESGQVNSEVLWALLQFGKGLRTAMALDRPQAPGLARDARLAGLLDTLAAAGRSAGPASGVVANLRTAFERRRREVLTAGLTPPDLLTLQQARSALDDRTVLLSTATVIDHDDRSRRFAYLVADDDQSVALSGADDAPSIHDPDGWLPTVPVSAFDELASMSTAGKNHLCVIPDGAVFDARWHTFGTAAWCLADDWVITLLPHPHLLFGNRGRGFVQRQVAPVLTIGVDRPHPAFALPELPDAEQEAAAVAGLLGGSALLGPDATVDAVLSGLPTARYVHLAAHGLFDPAHPAFHSLVLAGGPDATVSAWQVAELDLSSVRVVTLSACDSARVSTEPGDNVDGLPIAFLSAGARAVVGTFSPVATAVSRLFFERFYTEIAGGSTDLRDAFRAAQAATRAAHPDPADWAAFYFLGDWR